MSILSKHVKAGSRTIDLGDDTYIIVYDRELKDSVVHKRITKVIKRYKKYKRVLTDLVDDHKLDWDVYDSIVTLPLTSHTIVNAWQ